MVSLATDIMTNMEIVGSDVHGLYVHVRQL